MIIPDSDQLELLSNAISLAATYMKSRDDRRESANADDFKAWLRDNIFPRLLEQSDQTLKTVICAKARQRDQYDTMLGHLIAIRHAVSGFSDAERWSRLAELDRKVLIYVYEICRNSPPQSVHGTQLEQALGADREALSASARFLDENELLRYSERSSSYSIAPLPEGVRLAWSATNPDYEAALSRLRAHLPERPNAERLRFLGGKSKRAGRSCGNDRCQMAGTGVARLSRQRISMGLRDHLQRNGDVSTLACPFEPQAVMGGLRLDRCAWPKRQTLEKCKETAPVSCCF